MLINISLHEDGPPMWFLGEPKNPKIALTFMQASINNVDFDTFSDMEKLQIIKATELEKITVSVDINELKKSMLVMPVIDNVVPIVNTNQETKLIEKSKSKIDQILQERTLELTNSAQHFLSFKLSQLKNEIKLIKDIKLLRKMKSLEIDNANRKTIISAICKQIGVLNKVVENKIPQKLQDSENDVKIKEDFIVVESDEEEVNLTIDNEGNIITV